MTALSLTGSRSPPTTPGTDMAIIRFNSASGAGNWFGGIDSTLTNTFSHTASGSDRVVVVFACVTADTTSSNTPTATYGGTAMSSLGYIVLRNTTNQGRKLGAFFMENPPTGAKTVSVSWSGLPFTFANKHLSTSAVSYSGVSAAAMTRTHSEFGDSLQATNAGTSSSSTQSLNHTSSGVGDVFVFCHAKETASAFSTDNFTQRYTVSADATWNRILVGDTTGKTGTVTSTTTSSASESYWAVFGLRLKRAAQSDFFT